MTPTMIILALACFAIGFVAALLLKRKRKRTGSIWEQTWDPTKIELVVDQARIYNGIETGIFVRAKYPDDTWENVDIAELTTASLRRWLRSRDGDNELAETVVLMLLKHEVPAPAPEPTAIEERQ